MLLQKQSKIQTKDKYTPSWISLNIASATNVILKRVANISKNDVFKLDLYNPAVPVFSSKY
jgi:hypothetical protein